KRIASEANTLRHIPKVGCTYPAIPVSRIQERIKDFLTGSAVFAYSICSESSCTHWVELAGVQNLQGCLSRATAVESLRVFIQADRSALRVNGRHSGTCGIRALG